MTTNSGTPGSDSGLSFGAIIGIVVSALAFVIIVTIVGLKIASWKEKRRARSTTAESTAFSEFPESTKSVELSK